LLIQVLIHSVYIAILLHSFFFPVRISFILFLETDAILKARVMGKPCLPKFTASLGRGALHLSPVASVTSTTNSVAYDSGHSCCQKFEIKVSAGPGSLWDFRGKSFPTAPSFW
jgi:hypothetical protein